MRRRDFGRERRNRLIGIAAGAPWTPASDPDLTAWYDPEDNSTMVLNGDFILGINNKVGPANPPNYSNGNFGEMPELVTVEGHQMAHFDGLNDWWSETAAGNAGVQPGTGSFTVAILVRTPATNPIDGFTWMSRDVAALNPTWWLTLQRNEAEFIARDTQGSGFIQAMDETWADGSTRWIIIGVRDSANDEVRLYYGSGPTLTESSASPVATAADFDVDASNSTCGQQSPPVGANSNWWGGDLGEWLMIQRAMSASELSTLAGYLTRKWELTGP